MTRYADDDSLEVDPEWETAVLEDDPADRPLPPWRERDKVPIPLEQLLEFEAANPGVNARGKEGLIRRQFNTSAVRYYQQLNNAIDTEIALMLAPALVYALREARTARKTARAARRFTPRK